MPSLYDLHHKFVFIHVPKNAGSSASTYFVKAALMTREKLSEKEYDDLEKSPTNNVPKKIQNAPTPNVVTTLKTLKKKFKANNKADPDNRYWQKSQARARDVRDALTAPVYDALNSIAIVRNPWDRLGSFYHFIRRNPENPFHDDAKKMTFNEYVNWQCNNRPNRQSAWVTDLEGNIIVNNICRVESMREDMHAVSEKIFGQTFKLPHRNKTKNQWRDEDFKPSTIDLVRDTYRADFDLLGYPDLPTFQA